MTPGLPEQTVTGQHHPWQCHHFSSGCATYETRAYSLSMYTEVSNVLHL